MRCRAGLKPAADFQSACWGIDEFRGRPIKNRPQDAILPYIEDQPCD
jgi:hypothetical protein